MPNTGRKLSIVIPVFNEISTIEGVVKQVIRTQLPNGWSKEIIVVDDHSHDGTNQILKKLEGIKIVYSEENAGKGAALKAGFKEVTGDYVLIQDADAEYDPGDMQKLLEPIIAGKSEVVFGSRVLGKNKVGAKHVFFYGGLLITKIFNLFFSSWLTDVATCYKVFPAKYISDLLIFKSQDFVFDVIDLTHFLRQKGKIVEVPIKYTPRGSLDGKKMNWRQGAKCFFKIIQLFFHTFATRTSWMPVVLTFVLFFTVFFIIYFSVSTLSSGDDHFFHFRFAQEMLTNGFFDSFQEFKSIYISKMAQGNDYFMYYNFLFYLVVIPFTFIAPLFLAIKLYAVTIAALAFTLLYWCLKKIEIRNPFLWTFLIIAITNSASIWRFFLSRPYALAPSLLLLLLVFLYRKNHWGVFILSFAYLFWHSSTFFMPVCVAIAYYVIELFYRERAHWKSLVGAAVGTGLAILATYLVSHGGGFLTFIWDTLVNIYWDTIIGKEVLINEGTELYPTDFFNFIQRNSIIFAIFVMALCIDIFSYIGFKQRFKRKTKVHEDTEGIIGNYFGDVPKERRHLSTTVLVLTALFFLGTVSASARFGDYFTFFAAFYITLSFDYARRLIKISGAPLIRQALGVSIGIVLIYLFTSNMLFLQNQIARGHPVHEFFQTGNWLSLNSKPGEIVFNVDWSWFPQLYYWSPKNYYIEGLEPRFTYAYSPELFWKADHIGDGYICLTEKCEDMDEALRIAVRDATSSQEWVKTHGDKIAHSLRQDFQASYVVTSRDYQMLNYIMSENRNFKLEVYDATFSKWVFRVLPAATTTKL